jgi:dehydrogenase/reductase SDR family protein 1
MAEQKSGLIANISLYAARKYLITPVHGIIKAAVDKMSADTAFDLKEHGVKVFSLYPGSVATEGMKELAKHDPSMNISEMESPQFVGLCVAALALDNQAIEENGSVVLTGEIAEKYGFADIDGKYSKG